MTPDRTRPSVNRGRLTSVFSGQLTSALTRTKQRALRAGRLGHVRQCDTFTTRGREGQDSRPRSSALRGRQALQAESWMIPVWQLPLEPRCEPRSLRCPRDTPALRLSQLSGLPLDTKEWASHSNVNFASFVLVALSQRRQHGHHDTSDHHHRGARSWGRRLVRPGALVLGYYPGSLPLERLLLGDSDGLSAGCYRPTLPA
jgi:hypothetical protein